MTGMFQGCIELEYLDLSNFNTTNVTDMGWMFYECHKLKEIKGINNFNTINVNNMRGMFNKCKELEYLDLSNFNTSNVTNMENMFNECHKLKKIKGINNFDTRKVIYMDNMFEQCDELEYLILSKFNNSKIIINNNNNELKHQLKEEKNKIIKLENELYKERKITEEIFKKIIAVSFISTDHNINFPIACNSTDIFSKTLFRIS